MLAQVGNSYEVRGLTGPGRYSASSDDVEAATVSCGCFRFSGRSGCSVVVSSSVRVTFVRARVAVLVVRKGTKRNSAGWTV